MDKISQDGLGSALVAAPLHEQVKERILGLIQMGEWPEGKVIPSEMDLARQLGVSYGTIRHAMQDLTKQGVLMRRRRTGTVVTGRAPHHNLDRFYKHFRLHSSEGMLVNTDVRVLHVEKRPATHEEAMQLRLPPDTLVGFFLRLRLSAGRPVMIDRVAIPLSLAPDFPDTPEEMPELIYQWMLDRHKLRLGAVREKVTARLATSEDLALLELPVDVPMALLDIDEVAFDARNEPFLAMRHAALTDSHCYVNEVR